MEGRLHRIKDALKRLIKVSPTLKRKSWASIVSLFYEAVMARSVAVPKRAAV